MKDFRSYAEVDIEFGPKVNLLRGNNAQGKTNLLEAIYFLSTGRSFRTTHLPELIREGQPHLFIEAEFYKDDINQSLRLSYDGQNKKMVYGSTAHYNFTNLLGLLPTVLLAPEDIEIIVGSPQERRRFIDIHLAQVDPLYVYHLARYYKAMRQRNVMLRQRKEEGMESFETLMVTSATYLHEKRESFIKAIREPIRQAMSHLSEAKDHLEIHAHPSIVTSYAKIRPRELHLGSTLAGPHRDDFTILINGKEAKSYASQGQKRCAVTALKIGEWEHFYSHFHSPPLLSIDDFGVHLDGFRSALLLDRVSSLGQVFLTSPYEVKAFADNLYEVIGSTIHK